MVFRSNAYWCNVPFRDAVEDTRLEAKAKDTKKIRGQSQGQEQPFRGQTLSRPRTGILEAKAKDPEQRRKCSKTKTKKQRSSKKLFRRFPKNFFSGILQKKGYLKKSSDDLQTFSDSKTSFVLKRRTGQIFRTWSFEAKAKNFKMCPWGRPRGQGPVLGTASFF